MQNTSLLQQIKDNRELYLLPVIMLAGQLPQRLWNIPRWSSYAAVILLSVVMLYWFLPLLTTQTRSLKTLGIVLLGTIAICLFAFGVPALLQKLFSPGIALGLSILAFLQTVYWFTYWKNAKEPKMTYPFAMRPLVYLLVNLTMTAMPIVIYAALAQQFMRKMQ